jgi:hypothetical protein
MSSRLGAVRILLAVAACGPAAVTIPAPVASITATTHPAMVSGLQVTQRNHLATIRSLNWSGYEQGLLRRTEPFTQISATWTVPAASSARPGEFEASAVWVGIGGGCPDVNCSPSEIDPTLVQAGTEQDVDANGNPIYYAWVEMVPTPAEPVLFHVQAGDVMSVDVRTHEAGHWTLTVVDVTSGETAVREVVYPAAMLSAEWVVEAPTLTDPPGVAPLPHLAPCARFDGATVNGGPAGLVASEAITMVDASGAAVATPSPPDAEADGFSVCH